MLQKALDSSQARRPHRWRKFNALAWALVCMAMLVHVGWAVRHDAWDTDILALLPGTQDALQSAALKGFVQAAAQDVVVMLGAPTWSEARRAAEAYKATLGEDDVLRSNQRLGDMAQMIDFLRPYRDRFLTPDQQQLLGSQTPEQWVGRATATLTQPGPGTPLTPWLQDPLNLWPTFWQDRGRQLRIVPRDGLLSLHDGNLEYAVLGLQSLKPTFHLDGEAPLSRRLQVAKNAAHNAVPEAIVLTAGVPLHAEAAATRASWEVNTIGWGSLVAVLCLVWWAFRAWQPLALVGLSLGVGMLAGLSATLLVFGRVHVVTLVFGATLVGVAEDYGIHYFAGRQGQPSAMRWQILRLQMPGLTMAMATSALSYAAMGLAPFPGLRQMAVFSASGIVAAFLCVVTIFPWCDRGALPMTSFSSRIASTLPHWPRLQAQSWAWVAGLCACCVVILGISRLQPNDDLRTLQGGNSRLIAEQMQVGALLGLPSPAQFFLVQAPNSDALLEREAALTQRLAPLIAQGTLSDVRSLSDWLPSATAQRRSAELAARVESAAIDAVARSTQETLRRPAFAQEPLSLEAWIKHVGAAGPARGLWLGNVEGRYLSLVQLCGLRGTPAAQAVAAAGAGMAGVRWVDKTADISALLQRYRSLMGGLLVVCHGVVALVLVWRYRASAWRALGPTALASLLTLGCLGLMGLSLQLFTYLALLLVLGVGVDYGIFLQEDRGDNTAWAAVVVGATSTWLSFGLLSLSWTPALRLFGITMSLGIGWVWFLTPFFRPERGLTASEVM